MASFVVQDLLMDESALVTFECDYSSREIQAFCDNVCRILGSERFSTLNLSRWQALAPGFLDYRSNPSLSRSTTYLDLLSLLGVVPSTVKTPSKRGYRLLNSTSFEDLFLFIVDRWCSTHYFHQSLHPPQQCMAPSKAAEFCLFADALMARLKTNEHFAQDAMDMLNWVHLSLPLTFKRSAETQGLFQGA